MPRILVVSGNAPPAIDGVGQCTGRLLGALRRERPDWTWLWLARRPRWSSSPIAWRGGVSLIRPTRTWNPQGRRLASLAVSALRPDLIHVQEELYSFHETGAAAFLARGAGVPVVTTLHEIHPDRPGIAHTLDLIEASRALIANDPRAADRALALAGRVVDRIWWSGATIEPPSPPLPAPTIPGLVVTFGFLSALKALDVLHEALRLLRRSSPALGLRWRIIGPFEPESNPGHAALGRRLAEDRDWVELTGAVNGDAELSRLLSECALMALPFTDGASTRRTTLQTAWAFGLPVVTTPPGEPTDAIWDGENCLLVNQMTPEAWSLALERVLTSPALAAHLREGGLAAAERFSWPRLAQEHVRLYEQILGQ